MERLRKTKIESMVIKDFEPCDADIYIDMWAEKVPGTKRKLSVWLNAEVKNGEQCNDLVICAMVNMDRSAINMNKYEVEIGKNNCNCSKVGTENWHPNYHLGCRKRHLGDNAGPQETESYWDDATITMPQEFSSIDDDICSAYIDVIKGCRSDDNFLSIGDDYPGNCESKIVGQNKFLVPDDQTGRWFEDWVNIWGAYERFQGCNSPCTAKGWFEPGNSATMKNQDKEYNFKFSGKITNAPSNSTFELEFPPGVTPDSHVVNLTNDTTQVNLSYTMKGSYPEDDSLTFIDFKFEYPSEQSLPIPNNVVRFRSRVIATDSVRINDSTVLYEPGDTAHHVDLQMAPDFGKPFLVDKTINPIGNGKCEVVVKAGDSFSSAISASIKTYYDDSSQVNSINWDTPAMDTSGYSNFRDTFTLDTFYSYDIMVGDLVSNYDTFTYSANSIFASLPIKERNNKIKIYPNPGKGVFNFIIKKKLPKYKPVYIKLFDQKGNMVLETKKHQRRFKLNLTKLRPGVYYSQIRVGQNSFYRKIINQ